MGGDGLKVTPLVRIQILVIDESYLNNEKVRVDDRQQRREVHPDRIHQDVAPAHPVLRQVVRPTRRHVSLGNIPVPAEEGRQRPGQRERPHQEDPQHGPLFSQGLRA